MDKKEILKYYRESEKWLCSECDTENDMSDVKCLVCGCDRTPYSVILKKWNEEIEIEKRRDRTPENKEDEEDVLVEKNNRRSGCLIAVIIFIVLLIIGIYEDYYAEYEASLNNTEYYEEQVLNQTDTELFTVD